MDNEIVFYGEGEGGNPIKQKEIDTLKEEIRQLRAKDKNVRSKNIH
jgi:hypothetical protein